MEVKIMNLTKKFGDFTVVNDLNLTMTSESYSILWELNQDLYLLIYTTLDFLLMCIRVYNIINIFRNLNYYYKGGT